MLILIAVEFVLAIGDCNVFCKATSPNLLISTEILRDFGCYSKIVSNWRMPLIAQRGGQTIFPDQPTAPNNLNAGTTCISMSDQDPHDQSNLVIGSLGLCVPRVIKYNCSF